MPASEKKILLLGGTAEALELARRLSKNTRLPLIFSLAGRTQNPDLPDCETRIGGFGGPEGLATFLAQNGVALVIDATHPFATRMSANAFEATKSSRTARIALVRSPWITEMRDLWHTVLSIEAAAKALPAGARAFLALGSQHIAEFANRADVEFTLRMVDQPQDMLPENCRVITGKPGATAAAEAWLFTEHEITHLVCRNSGGTVGFAKIEAARKAGLPVIMIDRPPPPEPPRLTSIDEVLRFIDLACRSS